MPTSQVSQVVHYLRRAVLRAEGDGLSDPQLLERFVHHRDEAAFEALVRRHGPLVLGVCRRVLHNAHDAEDAFQATFLVLVHKAGSIRRRDLLANWLYGVAYRTALKARRAGATRRARERAMPKPEAYEDHTWHDVEPLVDQELSRLPEKYRIPILLCDLEGKTHKEAASQLGWPQGTLSGRLSRARALLARRLSRHGPLLSAGSLALLFSSGSASAAVPRVLLAATVKAAGSWATRAAAAGAVSARVATLTKGVLKTMLWTKLRTGGLVLLAAGLVALGVGSGARFSQAAGEPADPAKGATPAPAAEAKTPKHRLPLGPAPIQVLARMGKNDKVVILRNTPAYKMVTVVTADGKQVAGYLPTPALSAQSYALAKIKASEVGGKKLGREALRKRLRKEVLALASADGRPVDPLYLRLIKEGTLVLVLPATPAPVPLAPAMPAGPGPAGGAFPGGGPVLPPAPAAVPPGNGPGEMPRRPPCRPRAGPGP